MGITLSTYVYNGFIYEYINMYGKTPIFTPFSTLNFVDNYLIYKKTLI